MGFLSNLFGKKTNTYVGIDIGSTYIKVVQFKKDGGRIVLETYGEVALAAYLKTDDDSETHYPGELTNLPAHKLAEALTNVLTESNVTATNAVVSISSATSLIFTLELPRISERELAGVIENEARKHIPIPMTEISLDWWVIPEREVYGDNESQDRQRQIEVLIAAIRNEVVERYNEVMSNMTMLSSHAYEIETFSALRGSFRGELSPVMLVDFGASGTRIAIVEHGIIRKFHSINRGSAYLSSSIKKSLEIKFDEAEKLKKEVGLQKNHPNEEVYNIISTGINYVFAEVQNVLFEYEKEYKKPISKIILIGGGALLRGLPQVVENRFNITTVYADPFQKAQSPDFLADVLSQAGPEFAVACGLALLSIE